MPVVNITNRVRTTVVYVLNNTNDTLKFLDFRDNKTAGPYLKDIKRQAFGLDNDIEILPGDYYGIHFPVYGGDPDAVPAKPPGVSGPIRYFLVFKKGEPATSNSCFSIDQSGEINATNIPKESVPDLYFKDDADYIGDGTVAGDAQIKTGIYNCSVSNLSQATLPNGRRVAIPFQSTVLTIDKL